MPYVQFMHTPSCYGFQIKLPLKKRFEMWDLVILQLMIFDLIHKIGRIVALNFEIVRVDTLRSTISRLLNIRSFDFLNSSVSKTLFIYKRCFVRNAMRLQCFET